MTDKLFSYYAIKLFKLLAQSYVTKFQLFIIILVWSRPNPILLNSGDSNE